MNSLGTEESRRMDERCRDVCARCGEVRAAHHDRQCPNGETYFLFRFTVSDALLTIELRRLFSKGYTREQIETVVREI